MEAAVCSHTQAGVFFIPKGDALYLPSFVECPKTYCGMQFCVYEITVLINYNMFNKKTKRV